MSDPSRSVSADLLKTVSIVAVVFIHSSFILPFAPYPFEYSAHLHPPLYITWLEPAFRFCVPVFIVLWSYFAQISFTKRNSDYNYLLDRFYKLVIPFVFWSSIYFFIVADFKNITIISFLTKYWSGYGWSGQYYFIILFQAIPIFWLLQRIAIQCVKYFYYLIACSIAFYTIVCYSPLFTSGIIGKVSDRAIVYWVPYIVFGIALSKLNPKNKLPLAIIFGIALVMIGLIPAEREVFHHADTTSFGMSPYMSPSIFIASTLLIYLILGRTIVQAQLSYWLYRAIDILARNTLGVFCLNPLVCIGVGIVVKHLPFYFHFPGCSLRWSSATGEN